MAAPLMPLLRQQIVDGAGSPFAGAFIYAFIAGSDTPQDTYSDASLATPNENPVEADMDGRFPAIYLDPAKSYKFVIKDENLVEIFTQDNVTSTGTALLTVLTKTGDYTVTVGNGEDVMILASAALGNMTITLYTAVGNAGRKVRAIKTDTSTNTVTVMPFGGQTINGASSVVLRSQYDALAVFSTGTNWLQMYRSLQTTLLEKAADYTVLTEDGDDVVILVDATAGAVEIALFTAVGNEADKITVVKVDSTANAVTLNPSGAQTWNGAATKVLSAQWEMTSGISSGANWVQIVPPVQSFTTANNILANQVFS